MSDQERDKCKAVLDQLFEAKARLHLYWRYYVSLFGTSPERFDVFNKYTGDIFGIFHSSLRHTVILELAKLLGPHKSGGIEQVSIHRAINDMPLPDNHAKVLEWRNRLKELETKYKAIIDTRNNFIAHTSMPVATGEEKLHGISRVMIMEALQGCVKLTNDIVREFEDAECGFTDFGDEERNTKVLIEILSLGNVAFEAKLKEKQRKRRSNFGMLPPEDGET